MPFDRNLVNPIAAWRGQSVPVRELGIFATLLDGGSVPGSPTGLQLLNGPHPAAMLRSLPKGRKLVPTTDRPDTISQPFATDPYAIYVGNFQPLHQVARVIGPPSERHAVYASFMVRNGQIAVSGDGAKPCPVIRLFTTSLDDGGHRFEPGTFRLGGVQHEGYDILNWGLVEFGEHLLPPHLRIGPLPNEASARVYMMWYHAFIVLRRPYVGGIREDVDFGGPNFTQPRVPGIRPLAAWWRNVLCGITYADDVELVESSDEEAVWDTTE